MNILRFASLLTVLAGHTRCYPGYQTCRRQPRHQQRSRRGIPAGVHDDLRVTFRVKAPDAQKVEFQLGKRHAAQKGDDGFWTATTDPQVPGFHYYWLVIDGVQVNDPASKTFFGYGKETSGIEIPEKGVDYDMPKDVPHGEVRRALVFLKDNRCVAAHLRLRPARFDIRSRRRLPVLYLQHGAGEDERRLVKPGTRQLHPGQPARRAKGAADARGHGARVCAAAWRSRPPPCSAGPPDRARPECISARLRPDLDARSRM